MSTALISEATLVLTATGYGLDDRGIEVWGPIVLTTVSFSRRPDRLCGPPNLQSNGCQGFFSLVGKFDGEWSWPLTTNKCRGKKNADLHAHFPISLHGVVLSQLSTLP
jgi:hypothetical protein